LRNKAEVAQRTERVPRRFGLTREKKNKKFQKTRKKVVIILISECKRTEKETGFLWRMVPQQTNVDLQRTTLFCKRSFGVKQGSEQTGKASENGTESEQSPKPRR